MRFLALALMLQIGTEQRINVGKMLVATTKSHDSDLARAVILLIRSDEDGAIGLILNRPVKGVYFGGPITLGVRCLFRSSSKPQDA